MRMLNKMIVIILLTTTFQVSKVNACTNFCLNTPKGPIYGCNLDLKIPGDGFLFINQRGVEKRGFRTGTTGKTAEWISKYGSVTFNLLGREWPFGGMNEAGLVLATMELKDSRFPDQDERPPLPIGPWVQYILDTCGDIEDVIRVADKFRIEDQATPVHFLITDTKGNCVGIEWLDGIFTYYTGETLPVKVMSNSTYSEALEVCKSGGPSWWESDRGQSNERFTKAAERIDGYKSSGESNAIKYVFETLTKVVVAPNTKWNIVYDIAERRIYFRSIASPTLKYLSLKDLDFSCSNPMLMLDVNSALVGDVSKSFMLYDYDINLTTFKTVLDRVKVKVSRKDVEALMRHFESFKCTD